MKKIILESCHHRNCIQIAYKHKEIILSNMIYEFFDDCFYIKKLFTDPNYRRQGNAKALVKLIMDMLSVSKHSIMVLVPETNLIAQLFFKNLEFQAVKIIKDYRPENNTAYFMRYNFLKNSRLDNFNDEELIEKCLGSWSM